MTTTSPAPTPTEVWCATCQAAGAIERNGTTYCAEHDPAGLGLTMSLAEARELYQWLDEMHGFGLGDGLIAPLLPASAAADLYVALGGALTHAAAPIG